MNNKKRFIVIEGVDGTGKETQTGILINKLRQLGIIVLEQHFPRYDESPWGLIIKEYLNGKYGDPIKQSPYTSSIPYAADRMDASIKIKDHLSQNNSHMVVADRYMLSNAAYQSAKIENLEERKKFLDWLFKTESEKFKLITPDLTIVLTLPIEIIEKHLNEREEKDGHESNKEYLLRVAKLYIELAGQQNLSIINCAENNEQLSKEKISEIIWEQHILPIIQSSD